MSITPPHLGGHCGVTHVDSGALRFLFEEARKTGDKKPSFLDVGCGPMGQSKEAIKLGFYDVTAIDGDPVISNIDPEGVNFMLHDFTSGEPFIGGRFSVGWSCEFLEHVEEKYMRNYMSAFSLCSIVAVTAAPPNTKGVHHVNCKDSKYWIDKFAEYGLTYDPTLTQELKNNSTMRREFVAKSGLVFTK